MVPRRIGRYRKFIVREPLAEKVVYEDIPLYLAATRERVCALNEIQKANKSKSRRLAPDASLTALGVALKEFTEKEIGTHESLKFYSMH